MMKKRSVYAAVIGGGASGLICAAKIAERHRDKTVVIIEKSDRVGKKLLVTGNGRCNLSHLSASAESYHGDGSEAFINILFEKYNTDAVLAYFSAIGLSYHADAEGRVYPLSNSANSVLDVLRLRLSELGVEELCSFDITSLRECRGGYEIASDSDVITAEKLIIAVGGRADYAGRESGSMDVIKALGLPTVKSTPSLSPIKVNSDLIKPLKGVRAAAQVSLLKDGMTVKTERGEVQFTDNALSGICLFNLSGEANRGGCEVNIALLPDLSDDEVYAALQSRAALHRGGTADQLFIGLFRRNLATVLIKSAGLSPAAEIADLSVDDLRALAHQINHLSFTALPRYDFKNAQVTAGGVRLSEIDPRTFEAKRLRGLYLIGEALDIDGDCGGYNLQFAFASGLCAGDAV